MQFAGTEYGYTYVQERVWYVRYHVTMKIWTHHLGKYLTCALDNQEKSGSRQYDSSIWEWKQIMTGHEWTKIQVQSISCPIIFNLEIFSRSFVVMVAWPKHHLSIIRAILIVLHTEYGVWLYLHAGRSVTRCKLRKALNLRLLNRTVMVGLSLTENRYVHTWILFHGSSKVHEHEFQSQTTWYISFCFMHW